MLLGWVWAPEESLGLEDAVEEEEQPGPSSRGTPTAPEDPDATPQVSEEDEDEWGDLFEDAEEDK